MSKSEVTARPIFRPLALLGGARVLEEAETVNRLHLPSAVPIGLALLFVLGIVVEASGGFSPAAAVPMSSSVQQALAGAVPGRVVAATMTGWGDLTVEILLRDGGDARANRAAALSDALAIGRAVYQLPEPRPLNVTVLGLGRQNSPTARSLPALYASLNADRLVGRDWGQMRAEDLPTVAGVRWLPAGLCQAWGECG